MQGMYARQSQATEETLSEEDEDEHGDTLRRACVENYASDEFWICCDICEKWFHGKFVLDYLSVSSKITKDQFVLDVRLGSLKTRDVPTGLQITRVRKHASKVKGRGRGKLTNDKK
ncbi:PHD finger protein ALFIN-LIKE 3-like isoform X2 [Cucumis melo var. makuwa]|uniref:PHD finger protein ALFIN-LIKE n=1 Tax=Cucumis melo var. makuwa TaxID=1194695 RepID=A0A5D3DWW0_CUCMM|nr:PHD finger protein ALFIN-LIKE 3-like isoform X2 [Cucumis melo var. makuwa]